MNVTAVTLFDQRQGGRPKSQAIELPIEEASRKEFGSATMSEMMFPSFHGDGLEKARQAVAGRGAR